MIGRPNPESPSYSGFDRPARGQAGTPLESHIQEEVAAPAGSNHPRESTSEVDPNAPCCSG